MSCCVRLVPLLRVNVCCACVYTGSVSTVALNSSSSSAVDDNSCASVNCVDPSLTNIFTFCMGLAPVPDVEPNICILLLETLLSSGRVAPVAEIDIAPVPSEEIVAPPMSIVSLARNAVFHLLVGVPKSYVAFELGIKCPSNSNPGALSSIVKVFPAILIFSIPTPTVLLS